MINFSIPYGKQHITDEDINAVTLALKGDYLTQGPTILEFEKKFAEYIGANYAVVVSNGTAALHLAVLALGVQKGDKVITTPITFAASANCVVYCEGEVIFSDIDADTYLIDSEKIKKILEQTPKGIIKGIIPVDFAGRAVNLEELKKIADEYNLWIIEDACHSPGGYFIDSKGEKQNCGNGKFADATVFSFHPVKHIATGEGGMITTNNEDLYHKLLELRTHGINRNPNKYLNTIDFATGTQGEQQYPSWYMEMQTLGYNYRFTDFQAALGISQLKRAEINIKRRRQIAEKYAKAFEGKSYIKGQSGVVEGHAYHLYVIETENRLGLYNYLKENKIFAQIHYIPCHLMPFYKSKNEIVLQNAEEYYKNCISLPMFPTLTDEEQEYVIQTINNYYSK